MLVHAPAFPLREKFEAFNEGCVHGRLGSAEGVVFRYFVIGFFGQDP